MTVRTASFTLAALDLFPRRGHFGCPQDTPAWSTFPGSKRAVISVKSRNIAARPVAVVNALGYRTTTVYDAAAQKIAIVNANGGRYTFTIDPAGRTTRETDPLGRMTTLSYDNAGRQTAKLDARGVRTTFLWDNADRLVGRRYTNDPAVTFAYDDAGNRTLAQDTLGPLTFTYDALNRLRQVDGVANKTISYSYDPRGLRATMTDPDGGVTTYSHDPAGRLEYLINPQAERTTLSYDADNRQTLKHLANGARTSVTYDAANRVTQLYHLKSDQSVLEGFNYGYDAVANRTTAQEANGDQVTWSYDPTYQLINEQRSGPAALGWVPLTLDQWSQMSLDQWAGMRLEPGAYFNLTHTYDPVGNRLVQVKDGARTTFSYDPANQLETSVDSSGTTTYTFDQAGNQQLVVAPGNARTTSVWNDENRQVRLLLPDGKITTSTYSFDGLRRSKRDSSGVTYYIFDGQNYLQETDGAGVTKAQFTNTLDQFGRLISQSRKSGSVWTPSYYLFDAVGSTRLLLAADQSPSDTYWYEAFGNLLASTGETLNPFRYIGEYGYYFDADSGDYYVRRRDYRPVIIRWLSTDPIRFHFVYDPKTGLFYFYYRARYYHPTLGRFVSRDPIGYWAGDANLYRYVRGRPTIFVDLSGLAPISLPGDPIVGPQPTPPPGGGGAIPPVDLPIDIIGIIDPGPPSGIPDPGFPGGIPDPGSPGGIGPMPGPIDGGYIPCECLMQPELPTETPEEWCNQEYERLTKLMNKAKEEWIGGRGGSAAKARYDEVKARRDALWKECNPHGIIPEEPASAVLAIEGALMLCGGSIWKGGEFVFSKNFRVCPTGHLGRCTGRGGGPWWRQFPHYHRRGPGGIRRHRPWEPGPPGRF